MKKILFVVEAFEGGVFMHMANLSNQLCKHFDVYIAYGMRPKTHKDFAKYFDSRVKLILIEDFTISMSPGKDYKAVKELLKLKKEIKPDLIHLHSSKAGVLGRIAFSGSKQPLLYTPHGWAFLKLDDSALTRSIYRIIEKVCTFRKSSIVATSQGEYDEARKLTKNVHLINNGIDTEGLTPFLDPKVTPQTAPVIYTLGRICYQKNPALLNSVAERLPQYKFLWVGDGDMRDVVTSPNIEILGWGPRDESLRDMGNASIFILTSLWEGLPLSLLEAMYLRKVCIVSNVIGNRDVIHSGVNGIVANNVDEYVNAITGIIEGTTDWKKLLDNASDDVDNEYNMVVMANKYTDYYNKLIAG